MSESNKISEVIGVTTELVKAVPVYQDAVQPVAREVGKSLQTVGQCINLALEPLRALVWGYEQIKGFVDVKITEKLADTSPEKIQAPDLMIAGPTLDALRYVGHKEDLQEMYANLLANSMHIDMVKDAHPAFVDIIKNLSPDEAKIMRFFSKTKRADYPVISIRGICTEKEGGGYHEISKNISSLGVEALCENSDLISSYICNLDRLGLLQVLTGVSLTNRKLYQNIINNSKTQEIKKMVEDNRTTYLKCEIIEEVVQVTAFGYLFINACVVGPKEKQQPLSNTGPELRRK